MSGDDHAVGGAEGSDNRDFLKNTFSNVDLSAASYSRKKQIELQSIFAKRNASRASHVSQVIQRLDERGIGGVSLKNVHVEAFVHKRLEEYMVDGGEVDYDAMVDEAMETDEFGPDSIHLDEDDSSNVAKAVASSHRSLEEEGDTNDSDGDGDQNTSRNMDVASAKARYSNDNATLPPAGTEYLERVYESTRHHAVSNTTEDPSPRSVLREEVVVADVYESHTLNNGEEEEGGSAADGDLLATADQLQENMYPSSSKFFAKGGDTKTKNAALRTGSSKHVATAPGDNPGRFADRLSKKPSGGSGPRGGSKKEDATRSAVMNQANAQQQPSGLYNKGSTGSTSSKLQYKEQFDASTIGANESMALAYTNAAAHPARFRKLADGGHFDNSNGAEGEEVDTKQRDLEEVVEERAKRKTETESIGMVQVPDGEEDAEKYERSMKEMLHETKSANAALPQRRHVSSEASRFDRTGDDGGEGPSDAKLKICSAKGEKSTHVGQRNDDAGKDEGNNDKGNESNKDSSSNESTAPVEDTLPAAKPSDIARARRKEGTDNSSPILAEESRGQAAVDIVGGEGSKNIGSRTTMEDGTPRGATGEVANESIAKEEQRAMAAEALAAAGTAMEEVNGTVEGRSVDSPTENAGAVEGEDEKATKEEVDGFSREELEGAIANKKVEANDVEESVEEEDPDANAAEEGGEADAPSPEEEEGDAGDTAEMAEEPAPEPEEEVAVKEAAETIEEDPKKAAPQAKESPPNKPAEERVVDPFPEPEAAKKGCRCVIS